MKRILSSEIKRASGDGQAALRVTLSHNPGAALPFSTHLENMEFAGQERGSFGFCGHYFETRGAAEADYTARCMELGVDIFGTPSY